MAEVKTEGVIPVEAVTTNFTHCRGCGARDYCRRHGCQKMGGKNEGESGCSYHAGEPSIDEGGQLIQIENGNCPCGVPKKWCQYPACANGKCDTIAKPEDFEGGLVLIVGKSPALMGGCDTCPDRMACLRAGQCMQNQGTRPKNLSYPAKGEVEATVVENKICPQTQRACGFGCTGSRCFAQE